MKKTEHSGPKRGKGFGGPKAEAKLRSNAARCKADNSETKKGLKETQNSGNSPSRSLVITAYGYSRKGPFSTLLEMREVSFAGSPKAVRAIGRFFLSVAEQMEAEGSAFDQCPPERFRFMVVGAKL